MKGFFTATGLISGLCSAGALEHNDAWGLAIKFMLVSFACLIVTLLLPDKESY